MTTDAAQRPPASRNANHPAKGDALPATTGKTGAPTTKAPVKTSAPPSRPVGPTGRNAESSPAPLAPSQAKKRPAAPKDDDEYDEGVTPPKPICQQQKKAAKAGEAVPKAKKAVKPAVADEGRPTKRQRTGRAKKGRKSTQPEERDNDAGAAPKPKKGKKGIVEVVLPAKKMKKAVATCPTKAKQRTLEDDARDQRLPPARPTKSTQAAVQAEEEVEDSDEEDSYDSDDGSQDGDNDEGDSDSDDSDDSDELLAARKDKGKQRATEPEQDYEETEQDAYDHQAEHFEEVEEDELEEVRQPKTAKKKSYNWVYTSTTETYPRACEYCGKRGL